MAFVHEVQFKSSGFPGAPGYSNFYFESTIDNDGQSQFLAVRQFFETLKLAFPTIWSGQIQPTGRILEAVTGTLAAFTTAPVAAIPVVEGTGGGGYGSGVSGAAVTWLTATLGPRRLIRGRTFFVPMASTAYDVNGLVSAPVQNEIYAAATNIIAAPVGLGVWHRPKAGVGGVLAPVVAFHVTPTAVFLSSRRS